MATQPVRLATTHRAIRRSPPDQVMVTRDRSLAHNMSMHDASGRSPLRDSQGHWQQQVHLSRGHWRREDAAGAIRSAGWWESVTVTWPPAPAARRPAMLQRTLEAAAGMIAPVLADVAVTSARRLLQRRNHRLLVASLLRRRPAPAARQLPRPDQTP
jgi:hypothetical protein